MATTFNFGDRFSYPAENGVGGIDAISAQSLSDEELEAESQDLADMARMVRAYSVIIARRPTIDIFNIVTTQADPRIALILASAKRREDNQPLFAGLGAVKEIMYADPERVPAGTNFINRNLFSDGIRRVSAALSASILLGQLSQVPEQAEHSKIIEERALKDLQHVIETYDLSTQGEQTSETLEKKEDAPVAFYFKAQNLQIPAGKSVRVEWQSPVLSEDWSLVGNFTGNVSVFDIVLAIVDDLNTQTILNPDNSLLAAAELSGPYLVNPASPNPSQYHTMLFYPRKAIPGTLAFSINLRIRTLLNSLATDTTQEEFPVNFAPFIWGPLPTALNNYPANGSMIITRYNKISTSTNAFKEDSEYSPAVLYIRPEPTRTESDDYVPPDTAKLVFRAQPWQPNLNDSTDPEEEVITVEIPRLLDSDPAKQAELDKNRFSQVAVALVNSLATISLDTRVTGAIIRNDPLVAVNRAAAIELIAWSTSNVITHLVLDVLEVPEDIEIAVGDRTKPRTLYSSNPKSLQVKNVFSKGGSGPVDSIIKKDQVYVLPRKKPRLWKTILDESLVVEDPLWQ